MNVFIFLIQEKNYKKKKSLYISKDIFYLFYLIFIKDYFFKFLKLDAFTFFFQAVQSTLINFMSECSLFSFFTKGKGKIFKKK